MNQHRLNPDTIAAIATPPGRGGIGIIRISGPSVPKILQALLGKVPKPRYAVYSAFQDSMGKPIDEGITLYFPAPRSFTGEEVAEFHAHGGPIVLDRLLQQILHLGVRLAKPGEFSERAFLNNKMDLIQAEAIADLINATSEQSARAALRSLQGEFSKRIQQLVAALTHLRTYVEAAIDFPEEEADFLSDGTVITRLAEIIEQVLQVKHCAHQGALLREGIRIVITGRPNAGKSSLFNCLSGQDSAIVTDTPGTTRDVLREQIQIDGMPLHIIDTAGLRESLESVEKEGIRRAWNEINRANRVLLVVDSQQTPLAHPQQICPELIEQLPPKVGLSIIRNKIDLTGEAAQVTRYEDIEVITISAKNNVGIDLLRNHLKFAVGYNSEVESEFIARRRHLDSLVRAHEALLHGQKQLTEYRAGELLAEDLKLAQNALSEITGEFTVDDLLDKIFREFCIGK